MSTSADEIVRPEDARALELALALPREHKALAQRLRGLVGTENEGSLLAALANAEAILELKGIELSPRRPREHKATVSDASWDGSAARFTDEQYQRSCVLDRKVCGGDMADAAPKQRCSLPIREPSGTLNRNAVHAAGAALSGARGGVQACPAAIAAAKRAVRSAYSQIGEQPPEGLK